MAKELCLGCPVQANCLELALAYFTTDGVWGGATEAELKELVEIVKTYADPRSRWGPPEVAVVARVARGFVNQKKIRVAELEED